MGENNKTNDVFKQLNEYDITDMVKEKPGKVKIKYLPWAMAWKIIKSIYPDAKKGIIKDENSNLYHTDGRTCWVETYLTINGETQTEELAVMNHLNQAIPYPDVTMVDVNKAKQRCFVKTAALFGLGLSLWVGEELSEEAKQKKKEKEIQNEKNQAVLDEKHAEIITFAKKLIQKGVESEQVYSGIRKITGKKNPNAIDDVKSCDEVLTFLKTFEGEIETKKEEDK